MVDDPNDPLLTTAEAAALANTTELFLRRLRVRGGGPKFVKLTSGKRGPVRYRRSSVLGWFVDRERNHTSDPGNGTHPSPDNS